MAEITENFEDNTYAFPVSYGTNWTRSTTNPHSGSGAATGEGFNDEPPGTLTLTLPEGATSVTYWYRASVNNTGDAFEVLLNGSVATTLTHTGNTWSQRTINVTGATTLGFRLTTGPFSFSTSAAIDDVVVTTDDGGGDPGGGDTEVITEDFEDTTYIFQSISGNWARENTDSHAGSWALATGTTGHNGNKTATVTVPEGAIDVQFWYRVSSEAGFDIFTFLVDGSPVFSDSGVKSWQQSSKISLNGATQIQFRFTRDASAGGGSNKVWVDDVAFTVPVPSTPAVGWGIPIL